MTNNRHDSRIKAVKILYTADFRNITIEQSAKMVFSDNELWDDEAVSFACDVYNNLDMVDEMIDSSLTNYSISRLNLVDKAIIRLATSEMINGTPAAIVINEAIDITKEYSDEGNHKAAAFNNSLLDKISKNIKK